MKVLIVEDETAALENLKQVLHECDASIEIVGNTEGVRQTVKWLQNNTAPDLIFMDIHLSDGSSFNIFKLINVETPIIFTTAYDEYAIEAFRVNSIDYILKPVDKTSIQRALDKFKKQSQPDIVQYISKLTDLYKQPAPQPQYAEKMLVPYRDKLIPVEIDDIAFFYTADNITYVYLNDGKSYTYNRSLDAITPTLDPKLFNRANKQFIVSKKAIKNITIWFDSRLLVTLVTEPPERLYISKNRAAEFKKWLTGA